MPSIDLPFMYRGGLLVICALWLSDMQSQTATYQDDVDAMYRALRKTPAYKDQVRGRRVVDYEALYQAVRNDTVQPNGYFHDYHKLARLLFPLRDNHFGFNQYPAAVLKAIDFTNPDSVRKFRESPYFKYYPRTSLNLDSLEALLRLQPRDSIEGLYYYEHFLTVGLYRDRPGNSYTGVVLSSAMPTWERGQIAITLYRRSPGFYRAIYAHPLFKNYLYVANEKFIDHALANSRFSSSVSASCYRKDTAQTDHVNLSAKDIYFQFRTLSREVQYIRIRTFTNYALLAQESKKLVRMLYDSVTAPNLVLDLRNNEGGDARMGNGYIRFIRKYAKQNRVHVLVNNGTMSAGEIMALRLRKINHVTVYGQTTRGTLAYGNNYGRTDMLPRGFYGLYVSDMKDTGNLLRYEDIGITPDIPLSAARDWLEQVMEIIASADGAGQR